MKTELRTTVLITALLLAVSQMAVWAQLPPPALPNPAPSPTTFEQRLEQIMQNSRPPAFNPAPGLPQTIDPTTGLPVATEWKEPDWAEPTEGSNGKVPIVLANVSYVGLPLSEVVRQLGEEFNHQFDVIMPVNWTPQNWGAQSSGEPAPDWSSLPISLQLKNVTASEVFNALNMYFENNQMPVRWMLKMNGNRPTALLQVQAEAMRTAISSAPEMHMVFFVGDLIGSGTNGAPSLSDITDAIDKTWTVSGARPASLDGHLDIYAPGQMLIVNGTPDQVNLAQQTLSALKQKAAFDHFTQPVRFPPAGTATPDVK